MISAFRHLGHSYKRRICVTSKAEIIKLHLLKFSAHCDLKPEEFEQHRTTDDEGRFRRVVSIRGGFMAHKP